MPEKYSFMVIRYPAPETAQAALEVVQGLAKEKIVKLKDAVAITRGMDGKLKLHQTKDEGAGKGFLKGGLIGLLFAVLFGPAGWVAAGALLGTAFAMFDRGIKDKLLKELSQNMSPKQSALAVLVEEADWAKVKERMAPHNFQGELVVSEMVEDHLAGLELLTQDPKAVESVPTELDLPAQPDA